MFIAPNASSWNIITAAMTEAVSSSFKGILVLSHAFMLSGWNSAATLHRLRHMLAGSVGYLAVVAAQSIAALGALCQGAPVAAGPSLFCTLLKHKETTARDPNFTRESRCPSQRRAGYSPPGCRSRTPLRAPQSHFHTQEGPTAARETVFHQCKLAETQLSRCL